MDLEKRSKMKSFIVQQSRFCIEEIKEKFPNTTREQIEKVIASVPKRVAIVSLKDGYYEVELQSKKPKKDIFEKKQKIKKYILSQEQIEVPVVRKKFSTTQVIINQILDELLEEKKIFQVTRTVYWIKQPNIPEVDPSVKEQIKKYIQKQRAFHVKDIIVEFPNIPQSVIYTEIENAEILGWVVNLSGGFYAR